MSGSFLSDEQSARSLVPNDLKGPASTGGGNQERTGIASLYILVCLVNNHVQRPRTLLGKHLLVTMLSRLQNLYEISNPYDPTLKKRNRLHA